MHLLSGNKTVCTFCQEIKLYVLSVRKKNSTFYQEIKLLILQLCIDMKVL